MAAGPRPAAQQAETFRRARRDRAGEIAQDYVEAIADLSAAVGEARVTDLARRQAAGHVNPRPYRAIFLTDAGRKLAAESKRRHETVVAFLRSLGASKKAAELDAEGIEHHVSPETLAAFERWLKKR